MQWKSSEHGLTSSEFTVTQSVVSFYLALELILHYTIC